MSQPGIQTIRGRKRPPYKPPEKQKIKDKRIKTYWRGKQTAYGVNKKEKD